MTLEDLTSDISTLKKSWLSRLTSGLKRSSQALSEGISHVFTKRKLDDALVEELEALLLQADLGIQVTTEIIQELLRTRYNKTVTLEEVKEVMKDIITQTLTKVAEPLPLESGHKPLVILICGVNGNGKTTTIAKLAKWYSDHHKKVYIAACDTFRAAAVKQLAVWAERCGVTLIQGEEKADPASVAYRSLESAIQEKADILLIDTAGRLHNKANLMEELSKIIRVLKKCDSEAPHKTVLILDATTGQNAISQAQAFHDTATLTGLIVTKLDGTAKGGIVVALAKKFGLPLHALGVGESMEDLRPFDAEIFAKALIGLTDLSEENH